MAIGIFGATGAVGRRIVEEAPSREHQVVGVVRDPQASARDVEIVEIVETTTPEQIEIVRELFREYERAIRVDLCFQGFAAELAGLPGAYAPPNGRLLLAMKGSEPVGCAALRPLRDGSGEMKRLYVRPAARGTGLGRVLATAIIDAARAAGYRRLRLDTLASMTEAITLYRSLGFVEIAAYVHNPLPAPVYLEKAL